MSELKIAQSIRKYRKEKSVTQEQMAAALGISSQSISKWECGDGYPDITLLPRIAGYLEISVDTLLGTDEVAVREDVDSYFQRINEYHNAGDHHLVLPLAKEYYRKYPKEYHIATSLASHISRMPEELRKPHMPLLREACRRVMDECTDSTLRRSAVKIMCRICEDEELEEWLHADTEFIYDDMVFIMEDRLRHKGDREALTARHSANTVMLACKLFNHIERSPNREYWGHPEKSVEWNTKIRALIELLGSRDGEVADGWLGEYITVLNRLACALCAVGRVDEGLDTLEQVLSLTRRAAALPADVPRDLGSPLWFGETKAVGNYLLLPDGKQDFYKDTLTQEPYALYNILTRPHGWEWYDGVRQHPRFLAVLEEAKKLAEASKAPT